MKPRWFAGVAVGLAAAAAVAVVPVRLQSHKPITTNILFKNEIAQIFQRKCFQCHSDNNLAMSLTTYTEARPWARAIREEVLEGKMPPWQAVPGYGHFVNDLSLNVREKEIILSWADGGAPSGVPKAEEAIPPVYVPAAPAWEHGEPDLVLPIGEGHRVASGAPFEVKRFIVDTRLPAAKRVRAIALKQGDRRVVRHAAFFEERSGRWIGGWTPWQTMSQFASGAAVGLAANARLAVEIGYSSAEEDVTDKSEIGLYFAAGSGPSLDGVQLVAPHGVAAPGADKARVRVEMKLAGETQVLGFWPDPGEGARSVEITAVTPDGMPRPLLWINDFRPEWRSPYLLASAVDLPRGTRLVVTTYFANPGEHKLPTRPQFFIATAGASRRASAQQK